MHEIRLKRAYEEAADSDGTRILVDRMWPRGINKEDAALDHWFKQIAPSPELRKWFGHDADKWPAFKRRYQQELQSGEQKTCFEQLRLICQAGPVTLVFAARDQRHNNAVVLAQLLQDR